MDTPEAIKDLINLEIYNKRRIWRPFMEKYGCQRICELGVYDGDNFELMIAHNPEVAIAVDSWIDDHMTWGTFSRNDVGHTQEELDSQYSKFKYKVADKTFVKIFRGYTFDAVKNFPEEYFDLIYIDADHSFEGCIRDIKDWYPKVKKGGFLTGDDFRDAFASRTKVKFGVIEAVKLFCKDNKLTYWELPRHGWAIIKPL